MKKLQMFIHKYYETIKFILMAIILVVAFFILYNQTQRANQEAINAANETIAREQAIERLLEADQQVIRDIKDNQERQTRLIICLLAAHGANVTITPEDEETCRVLVEQAQEPTEQSEEPSPEPQDPKEPNEQPPEEPPEQPLPQWLIEMFSMVVK